MPGRLDSHYQPTKLKIIPENGVLHSSSSSPSPSPRPSSNFSCQVDPAYPQQRQQHQHHWQQHQHHHYHWQQPQHQHSNSVQNGLPIPVHSNELTSSAYYRPIPQTSLPSIYDRQSRTVDQYQRHPPAFHEWVEHRSGIDVSDSLETAFQSTLIRNHAKPVYPVMGSKAPRVASAACCARSEGAVAHQRRQFSVSLIDDIQAPHHHNSCLNPPMTQSAFALDEFGSETSRRFPLHGYNELGAVNAQPDWIPSPHIITTNKHHSRNAYCACCHGRKDQRVRTAFADDNIRNDAASIESQISSAAPHPYASKSMPRLRSKWKESRTRDPDKRSGGSNSVGYASQTLPIHPKRITKRLEYDNGLMMGSTSSGKEWPQTKSQIITNITAHYKRSLSSNNNNNNALSFSDLLDRTNDYDANVTPSPGASPSRAKLPISTSLRISTYDNVSTVTPNAEESVCAGPYESNNACDCVQTTNNSTCSRPSSHQPSVEPSSRGHAGNASDTSKTSRSRPGSNFWSSQSHRSRNSFSRESAGFIDENAEWAEIEKIMSSFGAGIVRHSVFEQEGYEQQISRHLSTQPNAPTTQSTAALETESTSSSSAGLWSVSSASGLSSGSSSSGVHDSSSSTVGTAPYLSDISSFDASTRPTSQGRLSDFLRPPTTMRDWLLLIGLATYEKNFVNNGFDDPNFLDCIEEHDLIDMGVSDFEHRMELLQAVSMSSMIDVSDENLAGADLSLDSWLSSLNLLAYRDNFARSGITDFEQASKAISDGRLFKMAGVTLLGHQRRMLQSIWKRNPSLLPRPSLASSNASSDSLGFEDCFPRKLSSDSDIFERNQLVVDQKRRHDERLALKKMAALYQDKVHASRRQIVDAELDENRKALDAIAAELLKFEMSIPSPSPAFPSLDSPTSSYELKKKSIPLMREPSFAVLNEDGKPFLTSQSVDEGFLLSSTRVDDDTARSRYAEDVKQSPRALSKFMKKARRKISAGELPIRPPHQSQPAHQQPPVQSWCHSPEKLLKSSCDYNAFYLGSTLLNDLQENQSIIKSIKKMKSSTQNIQKLPSITLSISYRGVSFRDSTTAIAICDHEVRNIHCAAQDDDDLRFLAYITKDVHVNKHFCHVFKAETMVSATEIILTLGQAFEVAFQLAMKVKSRTSTSSLSASMRKLVDDPDSLPPRETIIS